MSSRKRTITLVSSAPRICAKPECGTRLSQYNHGKYCNAHHLEEIFSPDEIRNMHGAWNGGTGGGTRTGPFRGLGD